jgi:transposase
LGLLLKHVGKPLTVILDNASMHTAKAIKPMLEQLRQKGLTLYFLPPYSTELNRIEILWRKVKYEWMAFKTRDSKILLPTSTTSLLNSANITS